MTGEFSPKQKEFWRNANRRWNVKSGATRSGKTYLDYYVIPKRIRAVAGKDGLVVLLGNTKGTLQRNVIEPLQRIWSASLVEDIRSDNTAMLFGEKCYCLGADKVNQVDRIRGSSIKYCYGDEVVTWHEDVFQMLKSRLDKPYSCFDGTCNPDSPLHWFKKFLDSDADIYLQEYRIDDNPFLSPDFVENLKKEYLGTVYYDRYILGKSFAATHRTNWSSTCLTASACQRAAHKRWCRPSPHILQIRHSQTISRNLALQSMRLWLRWTKTLVTFAVTWTVSSSL